jgi:hypothetical protein
LFNLNAIIAYALNVRTINHKIALEKKYQETRLINTNTSPISIVSENLSIKSFNWEGIIATS